MNLLIEQWGEHSASGRDVRYNFVFPIVFSDTKYSKSVFAYGSNGTQLQISSFFQFNKTSIYVHGFGWDSSTAVQLLGYSVNGY